jgi:hypothetical protein
MAPELKVWQINVISNIIQKMVHLYAFYVHQAALNTEGSCGKFLAFIAEKKLHQTEMFSMVCRRRGIDFTSISNQAISTDPAPERFVSLTVRDVYNFVTRKSLRDLKMFFFLSRENLTSASVFHSFAELEEDFLSSVETEFLTYSESAINSSNEMSKTPIESSQIITTLDGVPIFRRRKKVQKAFKL